MELPKSISDFIDNALTPLKERLVSRIGSAFLISWCVFNWDFIYYFLRANNDVFIKIQVLSDSMSSVESMLTYPAFAAVLFCFLYPMIKHTGNLLWSLSDSRFGQLADVVLKKSMRLTKEEQSRLLEMLEKKTQAQEEEVQSYKSEIEELQNIVNKLNSLKGGIDLGVISEGKNKSQDFSSLSSSELVKLIKSTDGSYRLKKFLAKELYLSVDDPIHKNELLQIETVLEHICKEHPDGWVQTELKTKNQTLSVGAVRGLVVKLHNADIVDFVELDDKDKVFLSSKTLMCLKSLMSGSEES